MNCSLYHAAAIAILRAVASLLLASVYFSLGACAQGQQCSSYDGGGICPKGNTCCPSPTTDNPSGCIPNDLGRNGVCCERDGGGCPPKYICAVDPHSFDPICQRDAAIDPDHIDPLVMVTPRYELCSPPEETLVRMHGLQVMDGSGEIAYYSSHGPVLSATGPTGTNVQAALIIIHGQSRNADDYFCSGHLASESQGQFTNVLVIAPKFLEFQDNNVTLSSGGQALRWGSSDHNKEIDQAGVWRYGSDATYPPSSRKASSFDALDAIVGSLFNVSRFPDLEKVIIFGHSSGGQMVQRWALLTNVENEIESWERTNDVLQHMTGQRMNSRRNLQSTKASHLRFVVANPSSYWYLDELRYINGTFRRPPEQTRLRCPQYNQWEYGVFPGSPTDIRYKHLAIEKAGGLSALVQRYAHKEVVYLAGSRDRCPTARPNDWCNSHGIETTCMDMLQGRQRLERHELFMLSLQNFFGEKIHKAVIIPGVGHDHAMILSSKGGLAAVFG